MNMKQLLIFPLCDLSVLLAPFTRSLSCRQSQMSSVLHLGSVRACRAPPWFFLKLGMRSEVTVVNDLADLNKWTYGESDEQVKQVSTVRFGSLFHSCVKIVKRN